MRRRNHFLAVFFSFLGALVLGFPFSSLAIRSDGGAGAPDGYPGMGLDLFFSTVKVTAALALTLVLLVALVWVMKRMMSLRNTYGIAGSDLSVLEMHHLGPKKAVALVKVLDRVLIVGVSEQSLNTLGELTPDEIEKLKAGKGNEPSGFRNILSGIARRGGKPSG